jgi:hypothetical protein
MSPQYESRFLYRTNTAFAKAVDSLVQQALQVYPGADRISQLIVHELVLLGECFVAGGRVRRVLLEPEQVAVVVSLMGPHQYLMTPPGLGKTHSFSSTEVLHLALLRGGVRGFPAVSPEGLQVCPLELILAQVARLRRWEEERPAVSVSASV